MGLNVTHAHAPHTTHTHHTHALTHTHSHTIDGFSPFPSILAYFPDLNDSSLPPHWNISQSLVEGCPTVLLDASGGCTHSFFFLEAVVT